MTTKSSSAVGYPGELVLQVNLSPGCDSLAEKTVHLLGLNQAVCGL